MNKRIKKAYIALWTLLLVTLGSYYLFSAPRTSVYSEAENRTLAGFPEITLENVVSGKFGEEYESYLLDQFPGRNSVVTAVNRLKAMTSFATHDEYLLIADGINNPLNDGDYQDSLNAILSELNQETESTSTESTATEPAGTQSETAPPETKSAEFPPIEEKPDASIEDYPYELGLYMDVGQGVYAVQTYPRDNVLAVTAVLNKYADLLPENGKLMFTVGPSSNLVNIFVNATAQNSFYCTWDEVITDLGNDNVYAFDAHEILADAIRRGEYVSFRTDNHWTPHGAYLLYSQMAAQAGKELCSYTEDFTITVEENFRGTYFRNNPPAYWGVEPDTLELLMPNIGVEYREVTGPDTYKVIDFLKMDANSNDRYTVYLGGPGGPWRYVECDNDETENCLLITDSFGLTVIPFLTHNYKQIHYYDARYYDKDTVGYSVSEMMELYNIHDIYVIVADFDSFYSTFLISSANMHLY